MSEFWIKFTLFVSATSIQQQQKPSRSKKNVLNLKNLEFERCQKMSNLKYIKVWIGNLYTHFEVSEENPDSHKYWHLVMVSSKLFMNATNNIESYPQVSLLAIIWCKIAFFIYFPIFTKFLNMLYLWTFGFLFKIQCHATKAFVPRG